MPDVNSFGIWRNASFKVFVQKKTDKNKIRKELLNINKHFFDIFHLEILKGKLVQKKTLKQGDPLLSSVRYDCELYNIGTIGGFVRQNDNKRKIYALTCNHLFPEEGQLAFVNTSDGVREIGTCVFTTREKSCDFAAIDLIDSFSDECDMTIRREDKKKVNAKLYTKKLHDVGLVHKIGAATDVTSGQIISYEYYDKEMDDLSQDNIFLVKGLNGSFSEEGDSGSLVFCRPNSVMQNYIYVLGMVCAQNITNSYDDDDCDDSHCISDANNVPESISVCYRIHTALELFKENQGEEFDVKFQDVLSVSPSYSSQSISPEDSIDILKLFENK